MNRLRTHKFKPNADVENNSASNNNSNNNNNNNNSSSNNSNNGLLNKITKRYSTLSSKITRRHQSGRKSHSPQKIVSGSYDMTGANSEDHRLEIGAPVLISTTTLDTDRLDVSEARLKQIGGGIAVPNVMATTIQTVTVSKQASPQIPSSGSENELYMDAVSGTPKVHKPEMDDEDEKYDSALETVKPASSEEHFRTSSISTSSDETSKPSSNASVRENSPELCSTSSKSCQNPVTSLEPVSLTPVSTKYDTDNYKSGFGKKQYSKSTQNLHRSELRMFLEKAPSVALDMNLTTADLEHCHDLPRLPELYGVKNLPANKNGDGDADKENFSPSVVLKSKSEPNTPVCPEDKRDGCLLQEKQKRPLFKSIDSLDIHRNVIKQRNEDFNSTNSIDQNGSKNSLTPSQDSAIDDFNLKSVSCQSLTAQNLFVSIDELNEITRQINESEEFNQEIDLEYCHHRNNLKPSERRITLLKKKNTRLMNLMQNKEKLKKGWSGVKHWIGEESTKIKDVVQKQATLQRVASSKLNLSHADCRNSPSVHGSMSFRQNELTKTNVNKFGRSTDVLDTSCDNIIECENAGNELESSFIHKAGDDISPVSKNTRREVRLIIL